MTSRDRRRIALITLELNARRLNDWWDGLGFWWQLAITGVVWNAYWLCMILAFRPFVMEAVS